MSQYSFKALVLTILILSLVTNFVSCNGEEINSKNADEKLKKDRFSLVLFYAPWQRECREHKKLIEKLRVLYGERDDLFFATADIYNDLKLASKYRIEDYCVLKYFVKGSNVAER